MAYYKSVDGWLLELRSDAEETIEVVRTVDLCWL